MTVPLGTPAAPHGDPVLGNLGQGRPCGTCRACPRYWLLKTGDLPPASSPPQTFTQYFNDFTNDGNVQGTLAADNGSAINAGGRNESLWLAFPGIPIPPGSTVTSATLSITCQGASAPTLKLDAVANANQAEPTGSGYASMPRTAANSLVTLGTIGATTVLNWDVTAIVQEVISASYWVNGGQIMMLVENTGQNNAITAQFQALASNAGLPFTATSLTINVGGSTGSGPATPDTYQAMFMAQPYGTVLQRELTQFASDPAADCQWQSPLTSFSPIGEGLYSAHLWTLFYGTAGSQSINRWYVQATGLPANAGGSGLPADVVIYDFLPAPQGELTWFDCLAQNTFYRDDGNTASSGNLLLPTTITLTPFWP